LDRPADADSYRLLAELALQIAARAQPDASPAREALDIRVSQLKRSVDPGHVGALRAEIEADWKAGQYGSPDLIALTERHKRDKVILDACVDALRRASSGDEGIALPLSIVGTADPLTDRLRNMGDAISERLQKALADKGQLADVLNQLMQRFARLEGDEVERNMVEMNAVIEEVVSGDLTANLRARLSDTAGRLGARLHEMNEQVAEARSEVADAQQRIVGLEKELKVKETEALNDGLTGLPNRRALDLLLPRTVEKAEAKDKPLTVLMMDIDHFKRCNDTYGHLGGDEVLRQVAERLRNEMRGSDFAARYGGEEFCVVLSDCPLRAATRVAERCRLAIARRPTKFEGRMITATISIGVAERLAGEDAGALLGRADRALYQSKENGRNRWTIAE
jgi:diguanylate cyclase (GGDEF)-like protein